MLHLSLVCFFCSLLSPIRAAFEEGRFCENFHSKASGWRSCESCGKVSETFHSAVFFMLLLILISVLYFDSFLVRMAYCNPLQRVHCGCIVSVHAYMLLDAGGVECIACAKKNDTLVTANHIFHSKECRVANYVKWFLH